MTTRWEYATVNWTYSIAPRKGYTEADNKWVYKNDIYIWRPGAERAEHRPVSDSEDESVSGPQQLDVLNELGAEGWELVARETSRNVAGKSYGWIEGSFPIAIAYMLKRPIAPRAE